MFNRICAMIDSVYLMNLQLYLVKQDDDEME